MLVRTAARPTTEWRAATIWGSSVAVIRLPIIEPMVPPTADTAVNWASTAGGNPTAAKEDRMPEPTPRTPRTLPWRAVTCDPKPDREAERNDS